jgi:site-specific recombinase XerC
MREVSDDRHGCRLRALIVVLWPSGVARRGGAGARRARPRLPARVAAVRNGKGGRRREIGMHAWGWEQLRPWLAARLELRVGPLFCVIDGPRRAGGRGRARTCASSSAGSPAKRLSGVASRRTSCATPMPSSARVRGVPLKLIQRRLGHANLGTTAIYLQGIDTEEIIATVHARRAPMMSATAGLQL